MEGVFEHDDLGLQEAFQMPVLTGKLNGSLIGLKPGITEKTASHAAFFANLGGNLLLQINAKVVRYMNEFGNLFLQCRNQAGMIMADSIDRDAGKSVKVRIALRVGEPNTLTLFKTHRER